MKTFTYESLSVEYAMEQLKKDTVQTFIFKGKITHTNANAIGDDLDTVFDDSSPNVIVDLSQLEYVNSVGIAVILSLVRRVEDLKGRFSVGGRHKLVETIVQLLEVSDHVEVYSSLEEAKARW
ncbi:MAG: STAS domain-containing protein [Leptospiraceae bacterium]|nr:STAS domain-containing protein [Leptospiraceae bacterium]